MQHHKLKPHSKRHHYHLPGSSLTITLSDYIHAAAAPWLVIAHNSSTAVQAYEQLQYLLKDSDYQVAYLPTYEVLPYDQFSASQEIISQRLAALHALITHPCPVVVTDATNLMNLLPPPLQLKQATFQIQCGQKLDLQQYTQSLVSQHYTHVSQVNARGEYSVRGNIIDIFPMGADDPYRIELFDNEIETIRRFDVSEQISRERVEAVNILPASEISLNHERISHFCANWERFFDTRGRNGQFYRQIVHRQPAAGIEAFMALFYEQRYSLFDYVPDNTLVAHIEDTHSQLQQMWHTIQERYQQLCFNPEHPILAPQEAFIAPEKVALTLKPYPELQLHSDTHEAKAGQAAYQPLPDLHIHYQYDNPYRNLQALLRSHSHYQFIFSADSRGRAQVLREHLHKAGIVPQQCDHFYTARNSHNTGCLIESPLDHGFIADSGYCLITESALFKNYVPRSARARHRHAASSGEQFRDLAELQVGSAVVHMHHGIGLYQGLTTLQVGETANEFLTLCYANNEKLYVPIQSLHLISRYSGADSNRPALHRLSSDKWQKTKEKAARKIKDVAADLLEIYAQRELKSGFGNQIEQKEYLAFCEAFPFEETEDQQKAIEAVETDMCAEKPMDRLICGDVGFGKTEIAMRAAFIALHNNKQVAILVPTTLLAQQHYDNFAERFGNLPVRVEVLSRFKTQKQQTEILQSLKDGSVDIIVGTHKLLSKTIAFNNLGLLIIDEEHRFGVTHKEKIKSLRANIDILTMTATPIPRTLNMALSDMRDLSIIATPPARRLSVKTFVQQYNSRAITDAVNRELFRGGQIFYLHNKVDTIHDCARRIQKEFPHVSLIIAHGQMRERELEQVMHSFQQKQYQILVCTTIVETGIDLPNVNTIIIEHADQLGLAQLHQLRGRVGRSHHQAYAYLLTPPHQSLSKDAQKRLEAIQHADSLGGGFVLANSDLEIRGAGELLGQEQSGHMEGIGFSLYMDLLQKTVQSLKAGKHLSETDIMEQNHAPIEVELRIPAMIPGDYVADVHTRLTFYKRIAEARDYAALNEIKAELVDRFGSMPEALENLFATTELKLKAIPLGINKIDMHAGGGSIHFVDQPPIDPARVIAMVQAQPQSYQLSRDNKLLIREKHQQAGDRLAFTDQTLNELQKCMAGPL